MDIHRERCRIEEKPMQLSALLVLSLMLVWGCAMDPNAQNSEWSFSEDTLLVDVRTAEEFDSGHIEGAKHIPYEEIGVRIGELTDDKSREIVLYCRSGRRSGVAQKTLVDMGFENAINAGGYEDLRARLERP